VKPNNPAMIEMIANTIAHLIITNSCQVRRKLGGPPRSAAASARVRAPTRDPAASVAHRIHGAGPRYRTGRWIVV